MIHISAKWEMGVFPSPSAAPWVWDVERRVPMPCRFEGAHSCPLELAGAALEGLGVPAGASQCYVLRGCAASHIADSPAFAASPLKRESETIPCDRIVSHADPSNVMTSQQSS